MMGRGGYHPPGGPPVDYLYDPYMDGGMGYYGGRPPFHPGRGHPGEYYYIYSVCILIMLGTRAYVYIIIRRRLAGSSDCLQCIWRSIF